MKSLYDKFIERFGGEYVAEDCKMSQWSGIDDIKAFLDNEDELVKDEKRRHYARTVGAID